MRSGRKPARKRREHVRDRAAAAGDQHAPAAEALLQLEHGRDRVAPLDDGLPVEVLGREAARGRGRGGADGQRKGALDLAVAALHVTRARGVGLVDLGDDERDELAEPSRRPGRGRARRSRTAGPRRAGRARRRRARPRRPARAPRRSARARAPRPRRSPKSDGYAAANERNSAACEVSSVKPSSGTRSRHSRRSRQWPPIGERKTPPVRMRRTGGTFSISGVTPARRQASA